MSDDLTALREAWESARDAVTTGYNAALKADEKRESTFEEYSEALVEAVASGALVPRAEASEEVAAYDWDWRIPQAALDMFLIGGTCPHAEECNSDSLDSCHWGADVHVVCDDASEVTISLLSTERIIVASQQAHIATITDASERMEARYAERGRLVEAAESAMRAMLHCYEPDPTTCRNRGNRDDECVACGLLAAIEAARHEEAL